MSNKTYNCWDCGQDYPLSKMSYKYDKVENELGLDEEDPDFGKTFYRCKSCD